MDTKVEYLRISNILKDRRKILKITQEQLAVAMNVKRRQIIRWEQAETYPDAETLIKWADYLDLKITITEK